MSFSAAEAQMFTGMERTKDKQGLGATAAGAPQLQRLMPMWQPGTWVVLCEVMCVVG